MKVTALVTFSLLSALLLLDLEPTCGIRLNEPYSNGDKSMADSHGLGQSSTKEHHHGSGGMSSESSTSSSSSNNGHSSSTSNVMMNSGSSAANKLSHSKARSNNKHTESIEDLLESGLWQVPIQLWNYLPHTNSINNHHANVQIVDHHGKLNRHHELVNDPAVDIDEDEDDEAGMVRGATNGRHHLSFIPDPDNSVSIHMPSSHAFLGQRLAGLNGKHYTDLTSQDYTHEDAGGGKPPAILKRTHSDNGPVGNRKTEDRKRANRPYDVPQIASPHLQPYVRIHSKWASQVAPRHVRLVHAESPTSSIQEDEFSDQNNHPDALFAPAAAVDTEFHPDTQPEVLHLQLQLSQAEEASDSNPHAVSLSQPLSGPTLPVPSTPSLPSAIVVPEATNITDASVGNYVNKLDIPQGLYDFWTIFRNHGASNVMMGDILHWHRQQQVQLACSISNQGIPDQFRLPLDYRGAQKVLELSSVFHVDVYCLCKDCEKWKPRSLFNKPFKVPCCNLLPSDYDSHFIVYQIHEILQLLLPYYKSRIKQGHHEGYSRLQELRETVNGTDDDVYISIGYDGVPFSPSSGISVYPVLGTIDGLSGRHTKASTFILAVWMGSITNNKPDVRTVFAPIVSQLKKLAVDPMTWVDYDGSSRKSRVFLTTVLTDTVARPQVMCLKQFNGLYGCAWCLHQRNKEQMWDYMNPDEQAPIRTNANLRDQLDLLYDDSGNAISRGTGTNEGIQGRTPFADLDYFDIVKDFPPCTIMHANYEGTAKHLLHNWCDKKTKIIAPKKQAEIDDILTSFKPPNRISRPPRQLSKLKKANEFCVWLFYTSPIVLKDYLPPAMYEHYLCLVRGLSLLHKEKPIPPEIDVAAAQLTEFLSNFSTHYGNKNGHYNIHILLHLCDFVRQRGPLYTYSLMPMESYNKHIKELPTGPKYVTMQMCTRFLEETVFASKMHSKPQPVVQLTFKGDGEHIVSKCPVSQIREYLSTTFGPQTSYFDRLRFGRRTFQSLSYSAVTATNSSCYKIGEGVYFDSHVFVYHLGEYQAVGKKLSGEIFNDLWYIRKCTEHESLCFVKAADLGSVVFKMEYDDSVYIAEFLNDFESYAE